MSSLYTLYVMYAGYSLCTRVHHIYEYYCFFRESISMTKSICNKVSDLCTKHEASKEPWIFVDSIYDDSIDMVVPYEEETHIDSEYFT